MKFIDVPAFDAPIDDTIRMPFVRCAPAARDVKFAQFVETRLRPELAALGSPATDEEHAPAPRGSS
jgi:hypothetical protein